MSFITGRSQVWVELGHVKDGSSSDNLSVYKKLVSGFNKRTIKSLFGIMTKKSEMLGDKFTGPAFNFAFHLTSFFTHGDINMRESDLLVVFPCKLLPLGRHYMSTNSI